MGRIPVFVNTDCILPCEHEIDWKRHCVWIEKNQLDTLPDRVADHHASLGASDFEEMQRHCRRVWEQYLSFEGFFSWFPSCFGRADLASAF